MNHRHCRTGSVFSPQIAVQTVESRGATLLEDCNAESLYIIRLQFRIAVPPPPMAQLSIPLTVAHHTKGFLSSHIINNSPILSHKMCIFVV